MDRRPVGLRGDGLVRVVSDQLRHTRNGPDIDVALCGARDMPIFVRSAKLLTCPVCREKREQLIARQSSRPNQMAARAKQLRERAASAPSFMPAKRAWTLRG